MDEAEQLPLRIYLRQSSGAESVETHFLRKSEYHPQFKPVYRLSTPAQLLRETGELVLISIFRGASLTTPGPAAEGTREIACCQGSRQVGAGPGKPAPTVVLLANHRRRFRSRR